MTRPLPRHAIGAAWLSLLFALGSASALGDDEPTYSVEVATLKALAKLREGAKRAGFPRDAMTIRAGYRPTDHEDAGKLKGHWEANEIERWLGGKSEHVTGKSIDFELGPALTVANAEAHAFDKLPAYRWLVKNASKEGFNNAFPDDPWHFTCHLKPGDVPGPEHGLVPHGPRGVVGRPAMSPKPELAERIVRGLAVGWDEKKGVTIGTQCWRSEGGGDACVVRWVELATRKVRRELPIFGFDESVDVARRAKMHAASDALAPAVAGAVALEAVSWPDAGAKALDLGGGRVARWDAAAGTVEIGGVSGGKATALRPARIPPWSVIPTAIYMRAASSVVAVALVYDPGAAYVDGLNLVEVVEAGLVR